MILMILFIILFTVLYIVFRMHTVSIKDDGKAISITYVVEKIDSDNNPYTSIQTYVIWTYRKF
jgi:hypothetical protein